MARPEAHDGPVAEVASQGDGIVRVRLGRSASLINVLELRRVLFEQIHRSPRPRRVVLELEAVERLDTAAVAVIVEYVARTRESGIDLRVARPSVQTRRMIELFHLEPLLHTEGGA